MPFTNLMNKARTSATKFFGSTLPSNVKKAHSFFSSHIVPNVKRIHSGVRAATESLKNDPTLSEGTRQKVNNVSRFNDLGLERFNTIHKTVDNVARAL